MYEHKKKQKKKNVYVPFDHNRSFENTANVDNNWSCHDRNSIITKIKKVHVSYVNDTSFFRFSSNEVVSMSATILHIT